MKVGFGCGFTSSGHQGVHTLPTGGILKPFSQSESSDLREAVTETLKETHGHVSLI